MYVVLLHYTAPTEEAALMLPKHSAWINERYEAGDFIAAGRRLPKDRGSLVIARAMERGRLDAILATDPLAIRHMVRPEVIEFQALRTIPELAHYADRLVHETH
jgi:uncharacterized protein YciI